MEQIEFDPNETYAAIYVSRINKDAEGEEDEVYYKLKEFLLRKRIASQVISKDKMSNRSFNYFLPNIAVALLAKLGGIPWRLYRPIKNDLVMGIGADRSVLSENRFIGTAFCFRNDGRFRGFNAFEKGDTIALADSTMPPAKTNPFPLVRADHHDAHHTEVLGYSCRAVRELCG